MQQPERTWTIQDLVPIVKKTESTIRTDLCRRPHVLPPTLKVPGSRRVVFFGVEEWLSRHAATSVPPARPGRPTKAEQIAKRKGGK